jgi:DNA invertase Pin-like site-specific DNA recombinase
VAAVVAHQHVLLTPGAGVALAQRPQVPLDRLGGGRHGHPLPEVGQCDHGGSRWERSTSTERGERQAEQYSSVLLTAYEMKPLGRDSAELTALADHLTAHGIALEMLAGPLPGIYDLTGTGRILFAFFAAMAETERENIREATLEGLNAAARKGNHGGRPPAVTEDMLHTVLRRRANGESVEAIRSDLIIPAGRRKGRNPSVASIYRALAEHDKAQAYPDVIEQAHAEFATLRPDH